MSCVKKNSTVVVHCKIVGMSSTGSRKREERESSTDEENEEESAQKHVQKKQKCKSAAQSLCQQNIAIYWENDEAQGVCVNKPDTKYIVLLDAADISERFVDFMTSKRGWISAIEEMVEFGRLVEKDVDYAVEFAAILHMYRDDLLRDLADWIGEIPDAVLKAIGEKHATLRQNAKYLDHAEPLPSCRMLMRIDTWF